MYKRQHLTSGNTEQVTERLDRGLIDFAVIVEPPNLSKYNYLEVPEVNTWGLVMKKNDALSQKDSICIDDLTGLDLICSAQAMQADIPRWCGEKAEDVYKRQKPSSIQFTIFNFFLIYL